MPVTGSYVEVAGPRWSVRMARKAVPRPWWEVVDAGRPPPPSGRVRGAAGVGVRTMEEEAAAVGGQGSAGGRRRLEGGPPAVVRAREEAAGGGRRRLERGSDGRWRFARPFPAAWGTAWDRACWANHKAPSCSSLAIGSCPRCLSNQ